MNEIMSLSAIEDYKARKVHALFFHASSLAEGDALPDSVSHSQNSLVRNVFKMLQVRCVSRKSTCTVIKHTACISVVFGGRKKPTETAERRSEHIPQ